jgi:hypothetical protein
MLDQQLRFKWLAREGAAMIQSSMTFTAEGLVLGAGTVLVQMDGPNELQCLRGQEKRLLALLSAFQGEPTAPSVLRHIERAVKAWSEGDGCLAYIHLAQTGLSQPKNLRAAAYRLEMARCAVMHGALPRAVFDALHFDSQYIDVVDKAYNTDEPRIPAGSGRTSGEWTDGEEIAGENPQRSSLLGRTTTPPASFLGVLDAAETVELGLYASRLLSPIAAAAAAFGLLFIPSPNNTRIEGDVPEMPGLRYSWNRDETLLQLTYEGVQGQRVFALRVDDDLIRDEEDRVVGRIIGGSSVVIDALAVLPDLVKQDEPRLCPAPAPDVSGSDQGKTYEENRSRQYEDVVKLLINPPPAGPTPSGFVYYCRILRAAIPSATTIVNGRTACCSKSKANNMPS